jgi:hypothetical protein
MPQIVRLSNCTVYIYSDDHMPPHFHVLGPNCAVQINLETLAVTAGKGRRGDIAEALEWARSNREILCNAWRTLNERD